MKLKMTLMTSLLSVAALALAADGGGTDNARAHGQYHTWTSAAGNAVEVYRKRGENAEGTRGRARGYRVTDPDGELVRSGRDRAFVRADGSGARSHARNRVRADGALVHKRASGRRDGDGNVTRARGKRLTR